MTSVYINTQKGDDLPDHVAAGANVLLHAALAKAEVVAEE